MIIAYVILTACVAIWSLYQLSATADITIVDVFHSIGHGAVWPLWVILLLIQQLPGADVLTKVLWYRR